MQASAAQRERGRDASSQLSVGEDHGRWVTHLSGSVAGQAMYKERCFTRREGVAHHAGDRLAVPPFHAATARTTAPGWLTDRSGGG